MWRICAYVLKPPNRRLARGRARRLSCRYLSPPVPAAAGFSASGGDGKGSGPGTGAGPGGVGCNGSGSGSGGNGAGIGGAGEGGPGFSSPPKGRQGDGGVNIMRKTVTFCTIFALGIFSARADDDTWHNIYHSLKRLFTGNDSHRHATSTTHRHRTAKRAESSFSDKASTFTFVKSGSCSIQLVVYRLPYEHPISRSHTTSSTQPAPAVRRFCHFAAHAR